METLSFVCSNCGTSTDHTFDVDKEVASRLKDKGGQQGQFEIEEPFQCPNCGEEVTASISGSYSKNGVVYNISK